MANGIDIKKITTFHGDCSFNITSRISVTHKDKYKQIFEKELVFSTKEETVSELIIMAMESVHNLYWKTSRTADWEKIHNKDKEQYISFVVELQKKYGIENINELFKKLRVMNIDTLLIWKT